MKIYCIVLAVLMVINVKAQVNTANMLKLINQSRVVECKCGSTLNPAAGKLKWSSLLAKIALGHAEDMLSNNYFNHKNKEGDGVKERAEQGGYPPNCWIAENIARGQETEEQVMESWMKSAGHCANIMRGVYTEVGVAMAGNYWVMVLAKPPVEYVDIAVKPAVIVKKDTVISEPKAVIDIKTETIPAGKPIEQNTPKAMTKAKPLLKPKAAKPTKRKSK